jgi:diguanylate cyclase (GGDEF)-like protein
MRTQQQLAGVLREFARTMVTDVPVQGILDHLVERIVEMMPSTAAGVTLMSAQMTPRFLAVSDSVAHRFEQLQADLHEGPCLIAFRTGQQVELPDLTGDERFPDFCALAVDAGLGAVFTFPLRHGDRHLGALDLYRTARGPLSPEAMGAAQTLADVAAAYLLITQARADLRDSSDRSREAALHDALTGLPNRVLLLERLEHALVRGRRSGRTPAVFLVDLDRFRSVNKNYGHGIGDELLMAVAGRLTGLLRAGDTLARLSGDEFVIVCEDVGSPAHASAVVARVAAALSLPFVVSGIEVDITASIGIVYADRANDDPEQILHDADRAMNRVKGEGSPRRQVFDLRDRHLADTRGGLASQLAGVLERDELYVEYQPIVETADRRITGVEALVRWAHPSRGPVPPAVLIPLAEHAGLITDIGGWVLEEAWREQYRWQLPGRVDDLAISVNVSAHQLMSAGFAATVAAVLDLAGTDPALLTLEITESVFVRDCGRASVVLDELKALGVMLALDDFGTGYSSLSYLRQFPVDVVKIDRTFVADLGRNSDSQKIVTAVIDLAHGLGMRVVAEGVETARQHRELLALGCDSCQGYYFARPMAATNLGVLVHHRQNGTTPRLPPLSVATTR